MWPNRPNGGTAWYWAALIGNARRYLLVRDEEVPLPRPGRLDVRTDGLWSALECETPLDHWTVGLEAFAVALDDPFDAWGDERGDVVGLGFDLEWEALEEARPAADAINNGAGYRQACRVSGEILVGPDERFVIDGQGARAHRWGRAALPQAAPPPSPQPAATHLAPLRCGDERVTFAVGDGRWWTVDD